MDLQVCEWSYPLDTSSQARRLLNNKRPADALLGSSNRASVFHLASDSAAHHAILVVEQQAFANESNPVNLVSSRAVTRRRVVMCEERNVSYPGRLVASRDEIRSSWLGRNDFKRIQADNIRSLAAIKREMKQEGSVVPQSKRPAYSLSSCPRGLEMYVTKLKTRSKKVCSPQRMVTRGVVDLYRQSCNPDAEQLRLAYRLLTESDRHRALRVAYLDELEAELLYSTPCHSELHISSVQEAAPMHWHHDGSIPTNAFYTPLQVPQQRFSVVS